MARKVLEGQVYFENISGFSFVVSKVAKKLDEIYIIFSDGSCTKRSYKEFLRSYEKYKLIMAYTDWKEALINNLKPKEK